MRSRSATRPRPLNRPVASTTARATTESPRPPFGSSPSSSVASSLAAKASPRTSVAPEPVHAARGDGRLQRGLQAQPGDRGRHRRDLEHRHAEPGFERGVHVRGARESEYCGEPDRTRITDQRLHEADGLLAHRARLEAAGEVGCVQLRRSTRTREFDPPMAQAGPPTGQCRDDLPRAELAQAAEVDDEARRARVECIRTRGHRTWHAERRLDRSHRREHAAVALVQRRVGKPGGGQRSDERLERGADRCGVDARQRVLRFVPRECCQRRERIAPRAPLDNRVHAHEVEQPARKQDATAATHLDAGQSAFAREQ